MPKGYSHLTYEQRCQICTLKRRGDSASAIAKELRVDRSTIRREVLRNSGRKGYQYKQAHGRSKKRRAEVSNPNMKMTPERIFLINEDLRLQWSQYQSRNHL